MCCNTMCLVGASCSGAGCGYCSECVSSAACNPTLCSSCLTGTATATGDGMCGPVAGTNAAICANTDVSALLPYAGMDGNGNEIYQTQNGALVYSDGSPATRADIACSQGACVCTPCSPRTCGSTDQPPNAKGGGSGPTAGAPQGGGSGGGSAKPSGGAINPAKSVASAMSQAMNRFGSLMASLMSGGKTVGNKVVLAGQKTPGQVEPMSANTFLLVLIIVGGLLLWMTFGHKAETD